MYDICYAKSPEHRLEYIQYIDEEYNSDRLARIFHTEMILKDFNLDNYLFGTAKKELSPNEKKRIKQRLTKEMAEIFHGRNIPGV